MDELQFFSLDYAGCMCLLELAQESVRRPLPGGEGGRRGRLGGKSWWDGSWPLVAREEFG